jgi:hypothetical protein
LYPNPTQKELVIQFKEQDDCIGSELTIVNQFGQVVKKLRIQQLKTTVNVSAFQNGTYFVTLYGHHRKLQEKFVKQ